MDDLSVLEKVTETVDFRGQSLTVSPLKVGQIPAFTRAIRPVFAALAGLVASIPLSAPNGEGGEPTVPADFELPLEEIAGLVAEHGEKLIEAVSIALRIKKEAVEDAEIDEFIGMVRAIVKVNADFFARAMRKTMSEPVKNLPPLGAGQTLSSS